MIRCISAELQRYLSFIWMPATNFGAIEWYERKIGIAIEYLLTEEGHRLFLSKLPYAQQFLSQMKSALKVSSHKLHGRTEHHMTQAKLS
jgi:hypothetical protein